MPLDGLQLGRYRLLHLLGAGGMGEVYLAEDTPIMRQVAIKVIKSYGMPYPGALPTDDVNRLFLREARAIAALQHPYILSLFDYGDVAVEGGTLSYMVMPYCQEGSLEAWLLRRGSSHLPSLHLIALILEQAADALQYAHEKQIIHQDVKLSNFLIHRWRALSIPDLLLADFGIAKFLSTHSRTSQSIRGTPTSMAPEQQISNHRQGFVSGKGLIMALLVLVLIAGSAGITFYLARTSPPSAPTKNTPATTQATSVNNATTATATVSPQTPTMTTTQPPAVSNPYPPYSGTLALNDPLSGNTRGYSWEEGTRDQGTCTFANGTYQSDIPLVGYFHSCLALSTDFSNCAYEVQMTLVSGSAGGIVFRADRATTHLYYFTVDRNGGYLLKAYYDKVGHSSVIARGSGISFHETELIGVVAQGSTISLYVNRQLIQQVQDGTFMQGQVGVVVYQGEAIFGSAKIWAL